MHEGPLLEMLIFLLSFQVHIQKRHRLVARCEFYWLVATCRPVKTSVSISSSCNKSVKIRLVTTCHLQITCNLVKQLATSLLITSYNNELATSLLTICNRLVLISCRKPCKRILILACRNKLFARSPQTCCNLCVFLAV